MIKKIFIKVKKPKGYKVTKKPGLKLKKYKPQSKPPSRDPYMEMIQTGKDDAVIRKALGSGQDPTKVPIVSLRQEQIAKVARRFRDVKSQSNIRKVRSTIKRKYKSIGNINDPIKRTQAKRLEIKAFTSAEKFAKKRFSKMSEKYGVGPKMYGSRKTPSKGFLSNEETRELGFAEREMSSSAKYQFAKSKSPVLKIKKLEKLYNQPKYKKQKKVIKARINALKTEQKLLNVSKEYKTIEKEVRPKRIKFYTDKKGQLRNKYVYGKPKWQKFN